MKKMMRHYGKLFFASALVCSALTLPVHKMYADIFDDEFDFADDEGETETTNVRKPLQSVRSPRHRDILYCLPTNQKFDFEFAKKKTHLAVTPVLHKASRMEFLADHINIPDLKGFLYDVTPPSEQANLGTVLDSFLPIFRRFTDQEWKAGFKFNFDFPFQRWTFSLESPFLISLRNLWVPTPDQHKTRQIFSQMPKDGPLKPEEVEAKLAELPYKVGFGDTRLKFGFVPIKSQLISTLLGFSFIAPTSRLFDPLKKTQTPEQAGLQFDEILNQVNGSKGDENLKKIFYQTIATLQHISLRPSLGTGHWGTGGFAHSLIPLFEDTISFWHKVSFDYFLPGHDLRYIISSEHTFPQEKEVILTPGSVIHSVVGGDFKVSSACKVGLYHDLYYQCEEHIRKAHIKSEFLSNYKVSDIEKPRAHQYKLGADFSYLGKGWELLLGGERVITHAGIGRGWSLFSEITCTF